VSLIGHYFADKNFPERISGKFPATRLLSAYQLIGMVSGNFLSGNRLSSNGYR
jgi:hypothetical protein